MAKLTLTDLLSKFSSITKINANNDLIEAAMENTLSLDGTSPNAMTADFDMNSNQILNLPTAVDASDPVRLDQVSAIETGSGLSATIYTVATLPVATTAALIIYVSDETGGAVLAFSDGTNWRRVTDRVIVS